MTDGEKQKLNAILDDWLNPEEIRLRGGDISPKIMRDILAVTGAIAREIRKEMKID